MSQMGRDSEVSARKTGRWISADRVAAVGVDLALAVPARSGRSRNPSSERSFVSRLANGFSKPALMPRPWATSSPPA
jgi:hypothetical protein